MAKRPRYPKAAQSNGDHTFSVGYGKPPAHTQFKPGQSGNPKGRRKGQRNVRTCSPSEPMGQIELIA